MNVKGVRLYGHKDIRLEEFELPEIEEDEILLKILCSGIAMSTLKEVTLAQRHLRVPKNIRTNPVVIGHEFSGVIEKVGRRWEDSYEKGQKIIVIPEIPDQAESPGYSYPYFGGAMTYCIIPREAIERGCLLNYRGDNYYEGTIAQALYSVIASVYSNYHVLRNSHQHENGIREGGNAIILGGCGPMGIMAIQYFLHMRRKPGRLVVTDVDENRLNYARQTITPEYAKRCGVELFYINQGMFDDPTPVLLAITNEKGYDDVFVYATPKNVTEIGNRILSYDGCMNIYAATADKEYRAGMNIYSSHYMKTKLIGSSGGLRSDMQEAIWMIHEKKVNVAADITHVGGINAIVDATLSLKRHDESRKKIIYNQLDMPLTAIKDFRQYGEKNPLYHELADSVEKHNGLWNAEAEEILLRRCHVSDRL